MQQLIRSTLTTLSPEQVGASHHADAVTHLLDAPPARTYTLRRHLDAPLALVWQVWTDSAQVPHWWGPTGVTFAAEQMDLYAGGVWQVKQTEPPEAENRLWGAYLEVVPFNRLVHTMEYAGSGGDVILEVVTFEADGAGTLLTDTMYFSSVAARDEMVPPGMDDTLVEPYDRLAHAVSLLAEVAEEATRQIVTTRTLPFAAAFVWQAFTDIGNISAWWGPADFSTTTHEADIRSGGHWRNTMHGPDGTDYPNLLLFEQVEPPHSLTYRHSSGGDDLPTAAAAFRTTVTLEALHNGATQLTLRMLFDTAAGRTAAIEQYGALEGSRQMLDRFSNYLQSN